MAMTSPVHAGLITYDLTYGDFDFFHNFYTFGTGKVTIDTSLVNNPGLTFQDGTNFVKDFSLTLTGFVPGTWDFADFNGSQSKFDLYGPREHITGGFGLYNFSPATAANLNAELVSQGVQFWIYPNGTDPTAPFSLYPDTISINNPKLPGLAGLITYHLSSMVPETPAVPEPHTMLLGALGIGGALLGYRRRLG
jgi:hypothetical protein